MNNNTFPHVFVDSAESLQSAIFHLSHCTAMAFDTEGKDLGRSGPLTIATFLPMEPATAAGAVAYVVDVQALGRDRVFTADSFSLRNILEDPDIQKYTFDCRTDSDALYHQFGVYLRGVEDMQVLEQAIRIHRGFPPPRRTYTHRNGERIPYLSGMAKICAKYAGESPSGHLFTGPMRVDHSVWHIRPLPSESISYAAKDVYIIKFLRDIFSRVPLSETLLEAVKVHSEMYEWYFRDSDREISRETDMDFILEEHSIVPVEEYPT
ncbi:unnamed protein product, partial [Ectocarpus fasciculatus]